MMKRPTIDTHGLHRYLDPGSGTSSTFNHVYFYASDSIPLGMEIFVNYGDSWFEQSEYKFGLIPLSNDYQSENIIVYNFQKVIRNPNLIYGSSEEKMHDSIFWEIVEDLWFFILNDLVSNDIRLRKALPLFSQVISKNQLSASFLYIPTAMRDSKWLEENGYCLDYIQPNNSIIKQAGKGAFATRSIKAGHIIAPSPSITYP